MANCNAGNMANCINGHLDSRGVRRCQWAACAQPAGRSRLWPSGTAAGRHGRHRACENKAYPCEDLGSHFWIGSEVLGSHFWIIHLTSHFWITVKSSIHTGIMRAYMICKKVDARRASVDAVRWDGARFAAQFAATCYNPLQPLARAATPGGQSRWPIPAAIPGGTLRSQESKGAFHSILFSQRARSPACTRSARARLLRKIRWLDAFWPA